MNSLSTLSTERVLDENKSFAEANRTRFDRAGAFVINLISAPGAGKTTILQQTLDSMHESVRFGVLEGTIQTTLAADQLARSGAEIVQLNTGGLPGSSRRVDARMVWDALPALPLDDIDILFIENSADSLISASSNLGEDVRVVIDSVAEGVDRPQQLSQAFKSADLVLINKSDLLPHADFDIDRYLANLEKIRPKIETILISATTGDGMEIWQEWLRRRVHTRPRTCAIGVDHETALCDARVLAKRG